jgi:hypothetical protein
MQTGVRNNQSSSQKKLKGSPKIMGWMRSHRETEKHVAAKGMSPSRIEPIDGRVIANGLRTVAAF